MNKLNYGNADAVRWRDAKRMANKLEKRKCSVKGTNADWQTIYMSLDGRKKKTGTNKQIKTKTAKAYYLTATTKTS